jgi:hypothetical protein
MAMNFEELDDVTRGYMLKEFDEEEGGSFASRKGSILFRACGMERSYARRN